MGKKRAVVLYRMSTDRQDLDTQKRVNRNFCKENDFEIIDEFFEDGVGGYKNPLGKRPDLIAILNKAERREFDVFVVCILDRIVRREEEYPLIINHLTINGVEIYLHKTNVRVILKLEIASSISNPFNIGSQQMVEGTIPNGMGDETHDQNYHWVKDTIPSGMGSKTLYSEQDKYFYITLSHEVA